MKIIVFLLLNFFPIQESKVGIVDIGTNTIPGEIYFSNINLRDFTSGVKSIDSITLFGQVTQSSKYETVAETDYFYSFEGYDMIFAQLSQTPELIELRSTNPSISLNFKNLTIQPGMLLDELTVPFRVFAKEQKVLPEFGMVSLEEITHHPSGTSSIRIIYDLDTEVIKEVLFLGSAL